jgi:hypothetical protein
MTVKIIGGRSVLRLKMKKADARPGFEPRLIAPKATVLPLDDRAMA